MTTINQRIMESKYRKIHSVVNAKDNKKDWVRMAWNKSKNKSTQFFDQNKSAHSKEAMTGITHQSTNVKGAVSSNKYNKRGTKQEREETEVPSPRCRLEWKMVACCSFFCCCFQDGCRNRIVESFLVDLRDLWNRVGGSY